MLCDGKILVQTFGDFQRGRRTTEERLCRNNIIPTLKDAVPGDLSLVLPHRIMVDIKEMLKALDKVTPGIASDETLLTEWRLNSTPTRSLSIRTSRQTSTVSALSVTVHP